MSNLVIVAIPDENDYVWQVSSEKIPHLTLLFLGEVDQVANLEQILAFVDHATRTMLSRFYLTVDHRGQLGEDQADVLFFRTKTGDCQSIQTFRAALLQEPNIRLAYDTVPQFAGPWMPHLTLGYPETPAKPDTRDFGIYDVNFNRIAVWTDDFDGPEFRLKEFWEEFDSEMPSEGGEMSQTDAFMLRSGFARIETPYTSALNFRLERSPGGGIFTPTTITTITIPIGAYEAEVSDLSVSISSGDLLRLVHVNTNPGALFQVELVGEEV